MSAAEVSAWNGTAPASGSDGGGFALSDSRSRAIWSGIAALWQKSEKNYCKILAPYLLKGAQMWQRPYLALGVSAQAGAAIQQGAGRDFVWDLYNLQFGVFDYSVTSGVIGSGSLGEVSATAYAELGFGVRNDVKSAWEGYFVGGGASAGLPLPVLSDLFSGSLTFFTGGTKSKNGVVAPDLSFAGAGVGLSAGVSSPGAASVSSNIGFWTFNEKLTKSTAERFKKYGIPVSVVGSGSCEGKCARFDAGAGKASYTKRALSLARSIPAMMNIPPGLNVVQVGLLALSVGAMRDQINGAQNCLKALKR
jgi:hypothetical protein